MNEACKALGAMLLFLFQVLFFLCLCWAAPLHHGVPVHHLRVGCCVTMYSIFSRVNLVVS